MNQYQIAVSPDYVADTTGLSDETNIEHATVPSLTSAFVVVPQTLLPLLPSWLFADLLLFVGSNSYVDHRSFGAIHFPKHLES